MKIKECFKRIYNSSCYIINMFLRVQLAKYRYKKTLIRIEKKVKEKKKLRVLFLINEPSKWKAQTLLDVLIKSSKYEPILVFTIADIDTDLSCDKKQEKLEKTKAFFDAINVTKFFAYDFKTDTYSSLKEFKPDYVVYQQPWRLNLKQLPHHVARYALTFYIPYYVANYGVIETDCGLVFHRLLFRYFVLSQDWVDVYRKYVGRCRFTGDFIPVGHPSLDDIQFIKYPSQNKYVIYAPHWSFHHPKNLNWENYSTFLWTGRAMLEYAKAHPEIKWVFKPHPTLRHTLLRCGVMTEDELVQYWSEWEKIGEVSYDSNYLKYFNHSSAMITDCGSFLTEYACTGLPIIHLISHDNPPEVLSILKKLYDTYYQVRTLEELSLICDKILLEGKDEKRDKRIQMLDECGLLTKERSAERILNYWNCMLS